MRKKEEEDYANVSKQLGPYPETERGGKKTRHEEKDRKTETKRRNKLDHIVRNK